MKYSKMVDNNKMIDNRMKVQVEEQEWEKELHSKVCVAASINFAVGEANNEKIKRVRGTNFPAI